MEGTLWRFAMEGRRVGRTLDLCVPARAASLARVRALLTAFLTDQGLREDQRHNAVLVVDELAANAIEHGSAEGDEVEVTITLKPRSLLIRILDPARTEATPTARLPDELGESGRGMLIVGKLATWTERLNGDRREVTAHLPLPP
jgi:anti-sigma regulatory factor (Ser/Thr protein kinase)